MVREKYSPLITTTYLPGSRFSSFYVLCRSVCLFGSLYRKHLGLTKRPTPSGFGGGGCGHYSTHMHGAESREGTIMPVDEKAVIEAEIDG